MALRFLIGLGSTIASSSAPMLAAELAHYESRTTPNIHVQYTPVLRTFQAPPAFINLIGLCFHPDSPRWLVGQDCYDEARDILIKYHANGDHDSVFVAAEFQELPFSSSWQALDRGRACANEGQRKSHIPCYFLCFPPPVVWKRPGLLLYIFRLFVHSRDHPFNIRVKAIALLMGSIKGASFFNQFVNPTGPKNLGWKYYIVYCVWLCVVLITNQSLEEISDTFEKYSENPSEKKLKVTDIECIDHQRNERD
ncbi:general substrate transporter [Fusarium agapanthi]|uniref:General substrate transporter n=1 Tax=Fusarium agapanthi TaxID=1803897 RepID=A0A9P5EHW5_9HYPO|nr:general substrate transporter [Fusarium agapanthi]